jgi:hypothetical protein
MLSLRATNEFSQIRRYINLLHWITKFLRHVWGVKRAAEVSFSINDLLIFHWIDDGQSYGPLLGSGKIGFRQMAPLIGEYANLTVHRLAA